MSFLYPRTVSVARYTPKTGVGYQGYEGHTQDSEPVTLITDLPASIQLKSVSGAPEVKLPTDVSKRTYYRICIPGSAASLGDIMENDVIIDDLGLRYQVTSPYWNSLGYQLICERLVT